MTRNFSMVIFQVFPFHTSSSKEGERLGLGLERGRGGKRKEGRGKREEEESRGWEEGRRGEEQQVLGHAGRQGRR